MARTSNVMLNKCPFLVPDLRENAFTFLPLSMLAVRLSYTVFITLNYVPSVRL